MKKLTKIIIVVLCLFNTQCTTSSEKKDETKRLSESEIFNALGKKRVEELYYTQILGELLLKRKDIKPIKENVKLPANQLNGQKISANYYVFTTTYGQFIFVILDREMTMASTENRNVEIHSQFMSTDTQGNELPDGRKQKEVILKINDQKIPNKKKVKVYEIGKNPAKFAGFFSFHK